jgi:hypothetical protein
MAAYDPDMGRVVDGAARARLALVITIGGALSLLMPSLMATSVDASSAALLTAVAALVATAVVGPACHLAAVVVSPLAGSFRGTDDVLSFLAARVTDTAHHPVRPRAPGVV